MADYRLCLTGPVRLLTADGRDVTPRPEKAQGLLALLGLSPGHRLPRAAAIDKLWSDRAPPQARASLRQVLSAIRRAAAGPDAGPDAGPVAVQGQWLSLDPAAVAVDLTCDGCGPVPDFAAGLDVRDPEFEDWLRDSRMRLARIQAGATAGSTGLAQAPAAAPCAVPAATGPVLLIAPAQGSDADLRLYGDIVLRDAAMQTRRMTGIAARPVADAAAAPPGALVMQCRTLRMAGTVVVQPGLERAGGHAALWSATLTADAGAQDLPLAEAVAGLTLAVLDSLPAGARGVFALRDVFSFDAATLQRADCALLDAGDPDADRDGGDRDAGAAAHALALRAYLRHTRILERIAPDPAEALREGADLAERALALAPGSALPLAVASLFAGLQHDDATALDLALRANRTGTHDPFVLHALSVAWSFAGDTGQADRAARAAHDSRLADVAPHIHAMRLACVAITRGDTARALQAARLATRFAPDFRAAFRTLAALEFAAGHEESAAAALQRLRRLEPDFSLRLMASRSYPVDTLRQAGLLGVTRSGLL